jgi:hypothetical protein
MKRLVFLLILLCTSLAWGGDTHTLAFTKANVHRVTLSTNFNATTEGWIAVTAWVKFASVTVSDQAIFGGASYGRAMGFWWDYDNSCLTYLTALGGGQTQIDSASWTPTVDTWYHLVVGNGNGHVRFWVNGSLLSETDWTAKSWPSTCAMTIGALEINGGGLGKAFDGEIAGVAAWESTGSGYITQANVDTLYNSGHIDTAAWTSVVSSMSLKHHFTMEEGTGTETADSAEAETHGDLAGTTGLPAWTDSYVAASKVYYVATDGNDVSGSGTKVLPWATITKARDTITGTGNTVYLRGGTYRITEAITFDSGDSGESGAPNVYRSYPGETAVLSGGERLETVWEPVTHLGNTIYKTNVGDRFFRSMWVDDTKAQRARTPNAGADMADHEYFTSQATPDSTQAIGYSEGDIDPTWTNLTEVEVQFVREYTSRRQLVASVDDTNNVMWMSGTAYADGSNRYYVGNRYWVENVFEGLDSPGEWYLNTTTHDLYYYPIGGKNPNTSTIIVGNLGVTSTQNQGVLLDNNGADYLEFHNLTFAHTDWYIPFETTGWDGYYIEFAWTGPMVFLRGGVDGSRFDNCTFKQCGGHGLYLYQGSHNTISYCTFTDIGGVPIRIGREDTLDGTITAHNTVSDNTISRYGADLPSIGMGIVVGVTTNCEVLHNSISEGSFMGIQLGRNTSSAMVVGNNRLEYNHIFNVQLIHADSGALYSTGKQTDSVYRYNLVHELSQGVAIYPDDSTTGITFEKNLIYDCYWGVLSRGISATVKNNVFASFKDPAYMFVWYSTNGADITNNIFYHTPSRAHSIHYNLTGNRLLDRNLYYNAAGSGTRFTSYNWTWATATQNIKNWGLESHGIFDQDPLFVDPGNHNYRLQAGSPALLPVGSGGIGFVDFADEIATVGPRQRTIVLRNN